MPESGWLKSVLEQANADRATWPEWQRGQDFTREKSASIDENEREELAAQHDTADKAA